MLTVHVRYFGKLRELLGVKKEDYAVNHEETILDLLLKLVPERHREVSRSWLEIVFRTVDGQLLKNKDGTPKLNNHLVLVNGKSYISSHRLRDGEEIAILPPFGGG